MTSAKVSRAPWWTWVFPLLAILVLVVYFVQHPGEPFAALETFVLIATVFAAVYHAEVIAAWTGEPLGSVVLAVAVTIIECSLIVSVMVAGGLATRVLARDTVFAAVMIACNGIIGSCLLAGGLRHHEQEFRLEGANAALSVLVALTTLTLVLPNFTVSEPGPVFSPPQLIFAAVVSVILYCAFLFVQTVRHRDYFLPVDGGSEDTHAPPPTAKIGFLSSGLLLVSLSCVVLLAKSLTPALESGIAKVGAPKTFVGIVIASLVMLPEGLASFRAARANRLQTSVNLALGSVIATIGLTIPGVAAVSLLLHKPLTLGLSAKDEVLLFVTLLISVLTLGTGRTTVLQGIVHLFIFAVFLFLAIIP